MSFDRATLLIKLFNHQTFIMKIFWFVSWPRVSFLFNGFLFSLTETQTAVFHLQLV